MMNCDLELKEKSKRIIGKYIREQFKYSLCFKGSYQGVKRS